MSSNTSRRSDKCTQKFTSPSAWLFHVESGKCKSGMTRQRLYGIVHAHDTDRHITYASNAPIMTSIATSSSGGSLTGTSVLPSGAKFTPPPSSSSSRSGVILTPDDSNASYMTTCSGAIDFTPDDSNASTETMSNQGIDITPDISDAGTEIFGGVVLTPSNTESGSSASSINGVLLMPATTHQDILEWSYITNQRNFTPATSSIAGSSAETVKYNSTMKAWPCSACNASFKTKCGLLQHMNSPAHAPKLFHCPPAAALGLRGVKPEKGFKTLSGFAQHIEVGACNGGMKMLKELVDIFESQVKQATGRDVKLLR